jgi:hypothetical protein
MCATSKQHVFLNNPASLSVVTLRERDGEPRQEVQGYIKLNKLLAYAMALTFGCGTESKVTILGG